MRDDAYESHLPEDLQSLADALRENRSTADGHLLERVQRRVHEKPARRRGRRLLTGRAAGIVTLALAAVLGARLTHVNVAQAFATVVSNISSPSSTQNNGTPVGDVYCGPGSGTGSSGWSPTFRWHYGGIPGADNGWSPSVQASCPSGNLSIRFNGGSVTVNPGNPINFGYDFHQANKPAFTLMVFNPSIAFTYKCGNGPTQTFVPSAVNPETWTGGTYHAPANNPDWIPTQDKNDPSGFQGTLTVPALCGAGKPVTFTGGTFSALIKIT
ncbi:MAG: hypothetical protein ACXVFQ_11515 [Solirubrobacteraceae bacterium]